MHATIRQFQSKIPRITPEPGSTIVLGWIGFGVCLFVCFFLTRSRRHKFSRINLEALLRFGVCSDTCDTRLPAAFLYSLLMPSPVPLLFILLYFSLNEIIIRITKSLGKTLAA